MRVSPLLICSIITSHACCQKPREPRDTIRDVRSSPGLKSRNCSMLFIAMKPARTRSSSDPAGYGAWLATCSQSHGTRVPGVCWLRLAQRLSAPPRSTVTASAALNQIASTRCSWTPLTSYLMLKQTLNRRIYRRAVQHTATAQPSGALVTVAGDRWCP